MRNQSQTNSQVSSTLEKARRRISSVIDWVFPERCVRCDCEINRGSNGVCDKCYPLLPFQKACCQRCGQQFAADLDYCGRCIERPPYYDHCFCPFRYEAPIDHQIRQFKYNEHPELAKRLAQMLYAEIIANSIDKPDILIPVPVHMNKLRERGYNQAWLLTQHLSSLSGIPCSQSSIVKTHTTPAQASLSLKNRSQNIRGCFSLNKPINQTNVALIDDVVTTGSTVNEIAKVLKRNGVDYVHVWGIAHTI